MASQEDTFLRALEDAMRAEFFPGQAPQPKSIEEQTRELLAVKYPTMFGDLLNTQDDSKSSHSQMQNLLQTLSAVQGQGSSMTAAQAERIGELADRLRETELSEQDREAVERIAHSARSIKTSTNYINSQIATLVPTLQFMNDFLNSDSLNRLTDPKLSKSERMDRTLSILEHIKTMPGLKDGINEMEEAGITGMSSLVNDRLESFTSQLRNFHQAAEHPKLPDLGHVDEFAYQPLPKPTSIRVLRVQTQGEGAAETNPNLITVHIEEADLAHDPDFNALSYVWGDHRAPLGQGYSSKRAARCFHILCDGRRMSVTYNLFCFLRRLAAAKQGEMLYNIRQLPLWIDQLCINQSDGAEKAIQVAMMDRVYSRAHSVVSWLGEGDSHVDTAARLLTRLGGVSRSVASRPDFDVGQFVKDIPAAEWLALGAFLARPYFKRVWIVQEVAMAQRLVVVCGKQVINWDSLVHCSEILEESKAWTMLSRYTSIFRSVQDQIAGTQEPLHFGGQLADLLSAQNAIRDPSVPASNLLLLGRQFDATVTADKFYALLGLHRRRTGTSPITINYSLPLASIALSFAEHHIQTSKTLALLTLVEDHTFRTKPNASFPSWLPDPAAPLLPIPFPHALPQLTTTPLITNTTLTLHGRPVTTISATAPPFSELTATGTWHALFHFVATHPPSPIPNSTLKPGQILWRVLTTSSPDIPSDKAPQTTPNLDASFRAWCVSLVARVANPNLRMLDPMAAAAVQQSYRLDETEFDVLAFGRDAGSIVVPSTGGVAGDVLGSSELSLDYMERRERERRVRDDAALARELEGALRRAWELDREDVFPGPDEVRSGREVLDVLGGRNREGEVLRREADGFEAAVGGRLEGRRLFWMGNG
ncbi:heterokaryon incompatibility protein 6, OR allele, partial [Echria macrotheca]